MFEIWVACKAHPLAAMLIAGVFIQFGLWIGNATALNDYHQRRDRYREIG